MSGLAAAGVAIASGLALASLGSRPRYKNGHDPAAASSGRRHDHQRARCPQAEQTRRYYVPALPGVYTVKVTLQGFRPDREAGRLESTNAGVMRAGVGNAGSED